MIFYFIFYSYFLLYVYCQLLKKKNKLNFNTQRVSKKKTKNHSLTFNCLTHYEF